MAEAAPEPEQTAFSIARKSVAVTYQPVDTASDPKDQEGDEKKAGATGKASWFRRWFTGVRRFFRWLRALLDRAWLPEVTSLVLACVAFAAIVVTLAVHHGRPLPQWPHLISINSLIAIFTAIFKAALLMPVAEALGQLKWDWFRRDKALLDLDRIDSASSGPWGSFLLLFTDYKHHFLSQLYPLLMATLGSPNEQFEQEQLLPCQRVSPGATKKNAREKENPNFFLVLFHRTCPRLDKWSKGPKDQEIQRIKPLFTVSKPVHKRKSLSAGILNKLTHLLRILTGILNTWRFTIFWSVTVVWSIAIFWGVRTSLTPTSVEGYGPAKFIGCMQQAWSTEDDCGLDGANCGPFSDTTVAYQCQPDCASKQVFEPHVVGAQKILYTSLVIGGARDIDLKPVYRADSSICQAAIHAGVIQSDGGIVLLTLVGPHSDFPAILSNGIQSVGFDSTFPKSFVFQRLDRGFDHPKDRRWIWLCFSVLATLAIFSLVNSLSLIWIVTSVCTMVFIHVALISDKPELGGPQLPTMPGLVELLSGRLLPAAVFGCLIYQTCVRKALSDCNAHLDMTVFWLGSAWLGALENYTFDRLPIRRLIPHDLQSQEGAIPTLLVIIFIILAIAAGQIHYFRLEHRFRTLLGVYSRMGAVLLVLLLIPSLYLRIHHYILALLLLPGTAIQTRPSLIYQGLLIGLFINGVARWGFDPILQTADSLRGKDGSYDSSLPTVTASPLAETIEIEWEVPPDAPDEGVSIVVNDVLDYIWYVGQGGMNYTLNRSKTHDTYVRFALRTNGHSLDFTNAGVWYINGTWNAL